MNRRNWLLVAALVLQLAVVAVVFWPRGAAGGEGAALFPEAEPGQVMALTITGADGTAVELRNSEGSWVLPEAGDFPAKQDTVTALISDVLTIETDRLVTQTGSSHKRLKVAEDDYERLVELTLADGTEHRLFLGSSPSFGVTHVRADDQDEVYLASLASQDAGAEMRNWIDTNYVSIPEDEVVGLTLENSHGRFEFTKDDAGTWTLAGLEPGETLDEGTVSLLVTRARSVTMLRPLGTEEEAAYGLAQPSAVVTVLTRNEEEGEKSYTLTVGAKDSGDSSYVVKSSESPYYVRVAEYSVKELVETDRAGFLVQPTPTPAPSPEATPQG